MCHAYFVIGHYRHMNFLMSIHSDISASRIHTHINLFNFLVKSCYGSTVSQLYLSSIELSIIVPLNLKFHVVLITLFAQVFNVAPMVEHTLCFLIISYVEHLFLCLLAIYIFSFGEISTCSDADFSIGLFAAVVFYELFVCFVN